MSFTTLQLFLWSLALIAIVAAQFTGWPRPLVFILGWLAALSWTAWQINGK